MQTVTIDLKKTPEIADAVAGMAVGEEVCLHATIKSLDDQSLVVTVEELSVPKEKEDDEDKPVGGNEGSDGALPASETGAELSDESAAV